MYINKESGDKEENVHPAVRTDVLKAAWETRSYGTGVSGSSI